MPEEKKISTTRELIQYGVALVLSVGLWFLLVPDTFWERVSAFVFCAISLVLISAFPYIQDKLRGK